MDTARAQEILRAAEAAEAARVTPNEMPDQVIRGMAEELVPAVEWLLSHDTAAAIRLVGALVGVWLDTGRVDAGREITERALLETQADIDDRTRAVAMIAAAELAFRQGDQTSATRWSTEAIERSRRSGDTGTEAMAETFLARVAYRDGRAPEIEERSRRALALAGDHALACRGALHMLAWAAHTAGDLPEARRRFEASLAYRRELGNRLSIAVELGNLGDLAATEGKVADAVRLLSESLEISLAIDSAYMLVNGLPSFAALAGHAGRDEDAARLFGAADAVGDRAGLVPDPGAAHETERANLQERLGAATYESLVRAGAALSTAAAVDLARGVATRIGVGAGHRPNQ